MAHKPENASHSPIVYSATNVYTLVVIRIRPFTYVRWSKGKGRCQWMGAPLGARHHGDSGALHAERCRTTRRRPPGGVSVGHGPLAARITHLGHDPPGRST
jgi:hypothetical protein